jgi:DNA-binding transcriptional MerR regulator
MSYTIGTLAAAAHVPTSTIRYYEREKLLAPDFRTAGNYRAYDEATLERLRFIKAAQATGFSLDDVREMLSLTDSEQPPCREVTALLEKRLADVKKRLANLRRVQRTLSRTLKTCCRTGPDWCEEIQKLGGRKPVPCKGPGKSCVRA